FSVENFPNSFGYYKAVKRIQKRIKMRYFIKDVAIRKIQAGCFNWIWKPICKDGSLGIQVKLGLTDFKEHLR
ncbi:hypothetical protein HDU92_009081, partial [Lobulomyces angularis]